MDNNHAKQAWLVVNGLNHKNLAKEKTIEFFVKRDATKRQRLLRRFWLLQAKISELEGGNNAHGGEKMGHPFRHLFAPINLQGLEDLEGLRAGFINEICF